MDVVPEKVGVRDGKERFVLINSSTGKVVTVKDVSEPTLRRFLVRCGAPSFVINEAFEKARRRYDRKTGVEPPGLSSDPAPDPAEDVGSRIVIRQATVAEEKQKAEAAGEDLDFFDKLLGEIIDG